jgi:hypothetical protein
VDLRAGFPKQRCTFEGGLTSADNGHGSTQESGEIGMLTGV